MHIITKEEVFAKIMSADRPQCPHCSVEMNLWEVPPVPCDDGLGWGTPYLYMCFNDECPTYVQGWDHIEGTYGRTASYRCICYPEGRNFEYMSVFGPFGGKGQIIDEKVLAEQEAMKEKVEKGFAVLDEMEARKDAAGVLAILVDANEPARVRVRAAEMIRDIGTPAEIDPLREKDFGNDIIRKKVEAAVKKIHERNFTRECPFCAEIIKSRAKICKHCSKEVAGQ